MKKLLALLLALTMVCALAACGNTQNEEPTAAPTETPTEAPTEAPTEEVELPEYKEYKYVEDRGDFEVTWIFTVMGDIYNLEEINGMSGGDDIHGITSYTDNGDGTITTGPWSDADSNKSDFFAPNGECTWIVHEDGTFEPVNAGDSSEDEGGINPGKYAIGDTGWNLMLKGSGEYALQEGESEDTLSGAEWVDNGDGTITTSALDDPSAAPEFVGDGSGTWTINEDGTATFEG